MLRQGILHRICSSIELKAHRMCVNVCQVTRCGQYYRDSIGSSPEISENNELQLVRSQCPTLIIFSRFQMAKLKCAACSSSARTLSYPLDTETSWNACAA